MAMVFENLDDVTRTFMVGELDTDEGPPSRVFLSPRLSSRGAERYPSFLRDALANGGILQFTAALAAPGVLKTHEMSRSRTGTPFRKAVPRNAASLIAEGEFNRYYIRGLCARLLDEGGDEVEVYRAATKFQPRPQSQAMIGMRIDPGELLDDLRRSIGREPTLLPAINSGLSVRIA